MNRQLRSLALAAVMQDATRPETRMELHNYNREPITYREGQRINPKRQAKKATGLGGRQWKKYRKAVRRGRLPLSRAERNVFAIHHHNSQENT